MNVWSYILEILAKGKMHMTLLDPAKQSAEVAATMALGASRAGSHAIMVGGSTGVTSQNLDSTVIAIKEKVDIPIILFPAGAQALSPNLDAIYFMTMLNSKDPRFLSREQMHAARYIKKSGVETISMGYIIVEPGMRVGEVSSAEVVKRDDTDTAIGYALSAQLFDMKLVYLEAGSGAPEPVPVEMVTAVKEEIGIPLVVGGGIRTPEAAGNAAKAGGDIIVTGTLVESCSDVESTLTDIVNAIML